MKKFMYLIFPLMLLSSSGDAQVGISTDGTAPDPSAGLDVRFSDRGVLLPRLTVAQRNAIVSPAEGLMVFCTDCGSNGALSVYSGGAWRTYSLCTVPAPTAAANTLTPGQVTWRWNAVPGATGYKWGTTTNYSLAADAGKCAVPHRNGHRLRESLY